MEKKKNTERLIELAQDKKSLLLEILEITKRQGHFIDLGKTDVLERQIHQKQDNIYRINELDMELHRLFYEINNGKNAEFYEIRKILEEIKEITYHIKEIDDRNIGQIKEDMDKLGNTLRAVNKSKTVSNVYVNTKNSNRKSIFFDQKK